jgi:hypothetical protein
MDAINDARKMGLNAQQAVEFSAKAELEAFASIFDGFDADTMFNAKEIEQAGLAAADAFGGFSSGLEPSAKGLSQFRENLQKAGIQGAPTAETFRALALTGTTTAQGFESLRAATGREGIAVGTLTGVINKNITSVNVFGTSVLKRALDFDRLGINLDSLNKGAESYVTSLDQQIDAVAQLGQLGTAIDFEKLTMLQEFGEPGAAQEYISSLINSEDLRSASYRALLGQISGINVEEIIKLKNANNFNVLESSVTDASKEMGKLKETMTTFEKFIADFAKAIDVISSSRLFTFAGSIITSIVALASFTRSLFMASRAASPTTPPTGTTTSPTGPAPTGAPTTFGASVKAGTKTGVGMGAGVGVGAGIVGGMTTALQGGGWKKAIIMTIAPILGGLLGGALGGALVGALAATVFGAPIAAAIGPTLIATMSGLGATAAGVLASKMTADDMISSPGYGNRTLVTPTGTFALNNNDTVMAGTNLFNKGTLQAPAGENSRLLDKIDRLVDTIQNATTTINVGGQVQRVPRFQLVGVHSRNEVE